ncbi:MAG: universal stress protein [Syntrophorhabdaceae bacterium]
MIRPKKILVPTDFSEYAAQAFERALNIAKETGAEVVLLHVVDQDISACTMEYCLDDDEIGRQQKAMLGGANERLAKEVEKFALARDVKVTTEVRDGIPYNEILKYEDLNNVDLIVIGSHGRSAIMKYFLGSVTSNVAKGAKSEVLLIK